MPHGGEHDDEADAFGYLLRGLKKQRQHSAMERVWSRVLACLILILIFLTLYHAGSYVADGIESATKAIF